MAIVGQPLADSFILLKSEFIQTFASGVPDFSTSTLKNINLLFLFPRLNSRASVLYSRIRGLYAAAR
jgi:hypothetical protein